MNSAVSRDLPVPDVLAFPNPARGPNPGANLAALAGVAVAPSFATLDGVPRVDIPANLALAGASGRRIVPLLREAVALRYGPGKLNPHEYFYYRLWDPTLSFADRRRFVGKAAQHRMHRTCNDPAWYAAAGDKLMFHTIMTGAGLPVPDLLAVTQADGAPRDTRYLPAGAIGGFLRNPCSYPLFIKPITGKYSLAVISVDTVDPETDTLILHDGTRRAVSDLANHLAAGTPGFLVQRRLTPHPRLAAPFGPALWSVRLIILMTKAGPIPHRAVVKIAVAANPADNFWRLGNRLGAVDIGTGRITRTVVGTDLAMTVDDPHPATLKPITGTILPDWERLIQLAANAAARLPGIRTQSWDIALTDQGSVLLEVNWGGDLNLAQLAHNAGMLDDTYTDHLGRCGYRLRSHSHRRLRGHRG